MYDELQTIVRSILYEDDAIQIIETTNGSKKAILYKACTPHVSIGEKITVNTTAHALKLGTSGYDFVKSTAHQASYNVSNIKGHIIKARYTPIQHSVLAIEEQESPYHDQFKLKFALQRKPVLVGELHSMVPLVYYVAQELRAATSMCVILDDCASLPLMISEQLRELHKQDGFYSITIGQAFGGMYEAVSLQSALQFACETLKVDTILVSLGPGVVGTGTAYGFSGMCLADWANVIGALNGIPVWIPRLSFSEKRVRHYGLSHHTRTALAAFTYAKSVLPLPLLKKEWEHTIQKQLEAENWLQRNHSILFSKVDMNANVQRALQRSKQPIRTMGRGYSDDPAFFLGVAEAVRVSFEEGG
ncbi:DUF3866 family protein [Halalkalibacterium ligniniphilum]|uniref:DUF3866 family protein n=1 Tax=Halalkalibacterium ligniniphilum TaxID=1134413 RepID=UPI00034ABF4A|nr:DUF3866 family protein [Halalkalibacterium ligniniphilum]